MGGPNDKDKSAGEIFGEGLSWVWDKGSDFFEDVADGFNDDETPKTPEQNITDGTQPPTKSKEDDTNWFLKLLGFGDKDGDGKSDGLGLGMNLATGGGLTAIFHKGFGMNLLKSFFWSSVITAILNFVPKLRDVFMPAAQGTQTPENNLKINNTSETQVSFNNSANDDIKIDPKLYASINERMEAMKNEEKLDVPAEELELHAE